jgi:hypothetical protein
MAAWHEREHQRPTAPILPQGNRPVAMVGRGARVGRSRVEHQTPQDPRLEDPGRGVQRAPPLAPTNRCCFHWLNPVSTCPWPTPRSSTPPGSSPRPGPSASRMTTPWPNRPSGSTRPNWSRSSGRGRASTTSRSPPPSGSTGTTTAGPTSTATTSHLSRPRPLTTLTTRPQRSLESQTRKSPDTPGRFRHYK